MKQKVRERQIFGDSDDEEETGEQDDYGEDNARAVLRFRLEKQLSALDREIEAVSDGAQAFQVSVDEAAERSDRTEEQMLENEEGPDGAVGRGAALHHALATDRLKSLLKKKKELRAQLRALSKQEQEEDDIVRTLVEDTSQAADTKRKGKKKVEVQVTAPPKPVKKAVSFVQDDDFDAALDAASGLMETVSIVLL